MPPGRRCGPPCRPKIDEGAQLTDNWRDRNQPDDDLDGALQALRSVQALGGPDSALAGRILTLIAITPQRRQRRSFPALWRGRHRATGLAPIVAAAWVGVAGLLLVALMGGPLLGSRPPSHVPGAIASAEGSAARATDAVPSRLPHVNGTCPVTPITRVAGGQAPEVDVSGLRWRSGFIPWVAGVPEKVVWLADQGIESEAGVSVFASWLDLPIFIAGQPDAPARIATGSLYALAVDTGWVDGLVLPQPGCWLLTATWSGGASSIVVAAGRPSGFASPAVPSTTPVGTRPLAAACPATPVSPAGPPSGWPGPAIDDGGFHWLLPPSPRWRFGGSGDKLVIDSDAGWVLKDMRLVAIPLVHATAVGWLKAGTIAGEVPGGFGGGTLGLGLTLPNRGCWVFVYLDPAGTSTIVDDLTMVGPAGFILPAGGIDAATAIRIATDYLGQSKGTVLGARSGPLSSLNLRPDPLYLSPDRAVWGVEFTGVPGSVCSPAKGASCVPFTGAPIIVLDYVTGAFLVSTLESYTLVSPSP